MSDSPESLEAARRQAEAALAGRSSPSPKEQFQEARDNTRKLLDQGSPKGPARLTRTFSLVLDELVKVPGTKFRFGVDPLLSLVPFAGTASGALFGTVVIIDAIRLRMPLSVLTRMLSNYVIDWLLGLLPVLGTLFDATYKSNSRNVALLNRTIENREQVRRASVWYWFGVVALLGVTFSIIVGSSAALLLWLDQLVTGK